MSLSGKRVVVLGGSSGIGLAVAEAVAREGATPVVVSRDQGRVEAAVALLPAGAEGFAVDVTDEAAVKALFERIGAFDHLVFTAGEGLQIGPLAEMSLVRARQFFETRYWGAVTAAKYGAPLARGRAQAGRWVRASARRWRG
jgi:NAD(P)-dependent dehydrogenase (short-subunit alcohol dehydrogenase family)